MTRAEFCAFVREHDNFVILTHRRPDGDTIRITIRYAIPQGIIDETQQNMHYQLPAGIALEQDETGEVYLENGRKAGTYTISRDG